MSTQIQASSWVRDVLLYKDEVVTMLIKNVTAFILYLEGLEAGKFSVSSRCM